MWLACGEGEGVLKGLSGYQSASSWHSSRSNSTKAWRREHFMAVTQI